MIFTAYFLWGGNVSKTICLVSWAILNPKMTCCCNSGSALTMFLKILDNERGQLVHENYINVFSENILIQSSCVI